MFKHILCPIDGSDLSLEALDVAASLAREQTADLTICTVVSPARASAMAFGDPAMSAACMEALDQEGQTLVKDAASRVRTTVLADAVALDGRPVEAIAEYAAAQACDLIVLGSHGRTGLKRTLVGSVTEGVVRKATVPVLVVRRTPEAVTVSTSPPAVSGGSVASEEGTAACWVS